MYKRLPSAAEAAALGLTPDAFVGKPVLVWPENRRSVTAFLAMRTQWRYAAGGATGLDYSALPEIWRRVKVPPSDRDEVFHDVQVMEYAALDAMHEE